MRITFSTHWESALSPLKWRQIERNSSQSLALHDSNDMIGDRNTNTSTKALLFIQSPLDYITCDEIESNFANNLNSFQQK